MTKKMSLGDRMKLFERTTEKDLLPFIPICARMDGRAFHTFTRDLNKPFDANFSKLMEMTTVHLVKMTGARCGYAQSDEISLIWLTDDINQTTFFNRRVLKMVSILASTTSTFFNNKLSAFLPKKADSMPVFDARVWNVPNQDQAIDYLAWRQKDCIKNAVTMAAQSKYSYKQLHKRRTEEKLKMLEAIGVDYHSFYPDGNRLGVFVQRTLTKRKFTLDEISKLPPKHAARSDPNLEVERQDIRTLYLPLVYKLSNPLSVVFQGADPVEKAADLEGALNAS